ncbi:hypothetical protein UlMin_030231 [Ulmus minor]
MSSRLRHTCSGFHILAPLFIPISDPTANKSKLHMKVFLGICLNDLVRNYQLEASCERWAQNVQRSEIKGMRGKEGLPSKRGSTTHAVCLVRAVLGVRNLIFLETSEDLRNLSYCSGILAQVLYKQGGYSNQCRKKKKKMFSQSSFQTGVVVPFRSPGTGAKELPEEYRGRKRPHINFSHKNKTQDRTHVGLCFFCPFSLFFYLCSNLLRNYLIPDIVLLMEDLTDNLVLLMEDLTDNLVLLMEDLTDNLVPDIVLEEDCIQDPESQPYENKQPSYVPAEMVGSFRPNETYHCYLIELKPDFQYEIPVHDVVIGLKYELETDVVNMQLDLQVGRGSLTVSLKYAGTIKLNPEQVRWCRMFQVSLFRILIDHKLKDMSEVFDQPHLPENVGVEYLLLPETTMDQRPLIIDWETVTSILFPCENFRQGHKNSCVFRQGDNNLNSKNGPVCSCLIKNSLVYTPHNGHVYCIVGILDDMNGSSLLKLGNGEEITYKNYFEVNHGISLQYANQPLLKGRTIFQVKNYLLSRKPKEQARRSPVYVELPPELCSIIMSPISPSTLYSFSFMPSIMHRLESLLIAGNLKRMYSDHGTQNMSIPTMKVLEALTTKKCLEKFHYESLETLGDSFLKYAACQHLFKSFQSNQEGSLSVKKERIISNVSLCRLGCEHKIPGFIQDKCFDPKTWIVPGVVSANGELREETLCGTTKIYVGKRRNLKSKRVADVVEALIGAFLSTGGEIEAIKFMNWIGIKLEFASLPYERHFQVQAEKHVNIGRLESMLNYSFRDPSLLVEALTHGSYVLPEIPTCYQRLEFLGDAVLDYLVTKHLYKEHPGMSPGLLTDMRSASVNNDCYALSAIKVGLHKHILHLSPQLHKDIAAAVQNFESLPLEATFGWDSESPFPKVLGDVIESLAGAIFVDSGYNKETVFQSIRPLLEPLVTPQTLKLHPVQELNIFVQKMHFCISIVKSWENGLAAFTVEVEANGVTFKHTSTAKDKKTAMKVACKNVLNSLKEALKVL